MKPIESVLHGGVISSVSSQASDLCVHRFFGEKDKERVIYMLEEAYFLCEEKDMIVLDSSYKPLSQEKLLKKIIRLHKDFLFHYAVYKDLRKKGHVVKPGLKFGGDFRVYPKGKKMSSHATWICFVQHEQQKLSLHEFASKNRVAHSTKKTMLLALVDAEHDVNYYETSWKKLV